MGVLDSVLIHIHLVANIWIVILLMIMVIVTLLRRMLVKIRLACLLNVLYDPTRMILLLRLSLLKRVRIKLIVLHNVKSPWFLEQTTVLDVSLVKIQMLDHFRLIIQIIKFQDVPRNRRFRIVLHLKVHTLGTNGLVSRRSLPVLAKGRKVKAFLLD